MRKNNQFIKKILCGILAISFTIFGSWANVSADGAFSVSPMNQKIILNPGESYNGSFTITNPQSNLSDFEYTATVIPFYVDESYDIIYQNNGDFNQITDWVIVEEKEGKISPNQSKEVHFKINVPLDAPAGGQYAAITITSKSPENANENSVGVQNKLSIAHIIYAEIAGTTVRKGEVISATVPSFLLSGNVSGKTAIKNIGNVHGTATYKLQVFPLFSNEEAYTNEENPDTRTILPDRTLYNTTEWNNTPTIGIFNVAYTAEFEGVTTEVKKLVIICPLWLLFIILFAIMLIIFWLVSRARARKKRTN